VRLHKRYNAEGITQYNIVPGLMGVVLTMTMVMMTAAVTRERERGTMENLLAMPVQPMEVMLGRSCPYSGRLCSGRHHRCRRALFFAAAGRLLPS
jgi:ABC-2 type transport system permease protein